jgi:hypothetical protein
MGMQVAWSDSSGDTRPLQARYDDVAAKLRAMGGAPTVPVTEANLFEMKRQLIELAPVPTYDPARSQACDELGILCDRYNVAVRNIEIAQRHLESRIGEKIHRLLGDISNNWNVKPADKLRHGVDYQNTTAEEARAAYTRAIPAVLAVEELRGKLESALNAKERTPPETLIWKLFDRVERIERRLTALAAACDQRLDEIAGQIERISKTARYIRRAKQKE